MPLQSDVTINTAKFNPATNSEQSTKFNEGVVKLLEGAPKWYEVGAAKYRELHWQGRATLPAPVVIKEGVSFKIASRDSGRDIPCRVIYPTSRKGAEERKKCRGVVMHFHGGGWTLGDERSYDALLQHYADSGDLAAVSVGYRHGPEDPFPAAPQDCFDAAEYLVKNSEKEYGGPVRFIGGESAGAHLSLLTTFHLLRTQPSFFLPNGGLLLHFGCYDLTALPSVGHFTKPLVINDAIIYKFIDSFLPGASLEQKKEPSISPYYEDLDKFKGRLPYALFTIGTEDALVDDTLNMSVKWLVKGGKAITRVYQGAPHGFIVFPPSAMKEVEEVLGDCKVFIQERLEGA